MPQSIFLGPAYYGEQQDNLREIEEKLNATFAELAALYPSAAPSMALLNLTFNTYYGAPDPLPRYAGQAER